MVICPFCKIKTNFLYRVDGFKKPLEIYQCPSCKLQMQDITNPDGFYTKDYFEGTAEYSYFDERKYFRYCEFVWKARLKTIKKFKPPPARFLDVGCSFGGFVKTALKEGYDAEGIDISPYVVEECQKDEEIKNRIFCSDLLHYIPNKKYDIITLIEVIEHLPEPNRILKKLYDLLNPSGLLIIQTANFDGLQAKMQKNHYHYYLPGHLFYYSKKNLTAFLKQAGFKEFIYFHGVDFGLLPKWKKMSGFIPPIYFYRYLRVGFYHLLSKITWGDFALTSSFVLYAFK